MRMLLAALLLCGCAAAPGLVRQSPARLDARYTRLLVVGVGQDEASRRATEAAFAARLPGSTPASALIAGRPTPATLRAAAFRIRADGLLAVRLLRVTDHQDGEVGYVRGLPAAADPVGFAAFYARAANPDPARYEAGALEIDLWSAATDSLAWSALSAVFTPGEAGAIARQTALETAAALK